jgi:hypothetical protein
MMLLFRAMAFGMLCCDRYRCATDAGFSKLSSSLHQHRKWGRCPLSGGRVMRYATPVPVAGRRLCIMRNV